ncbi:MAG: protein kinase [Kiritimatiellae bacterium]|nr:protein kinase [Kiritimatiellia bacterium]
MAEDGDDGLDAYLRTHSGEGDDWTVPSGTLLGGAWRVTAPLGRGGSSEVYCVRNALTGAYAAAKILYRPEEAQRRRFEREMELLSTMGSPSFPAFYLGGEYEGRLFMVLELLDEMPVPRGDQAVARYLAAVAKGVGGLHALGYVHRDLKPKNILRRKSDGAPVVVDLGLACPVRTAQEEAVAADRLSVVEGRPAGVGTPGYAAPEQFAGGDVTPAADVHALGILLDACFGGAPPSRWRRVIRRATSTIPRERYRDAEEFARSVKWVAATGAFKRLAAWTAAAALVAFAAVATIRQMSGARQVAERLRWWWMCTDEPAELLELGPMSVAKYSVTTNEAAVCFNRKMGKVMFPEVQTNVVEYTRPVVTNAGWATTVRLRRGQNTFAHPIRLKDNHRYRIVGPGVLDAELVSEGTNTVIYPLRCLIVNRSKIPVSESGISYVFTERAAYLTFAGLDDLIPPGNVLPTMEVARKRQEELERHFSWVTYPGNEFFTGVYCRNPTNETELCEMRGEADCFDPAKARRFP